ncbi:hypothetical protein CkaCkLH20_05238 [Colletotrichum karsti]|uniref:Uncharacterized protein n=1 Tax=Colletotrichum karsti TaxID=1095194 RepID=A0A9P6I594_9PEZI|nr:uncharacterized protein CkaCkLH20_05238 [Colletotrichum karsti]KAF9877538.1 hypothetical protein CkaCkLH20_05238 [Colletotrichum karsti]
MFIRQRKSQFQKASDESRSCLTFTYLPSQSVYLSLHCNEHANRHCLDFSSSVIDSLRTCSLADLSSSSLDLIHLQAALLTIHQPRPNMASKKSNLGKRQRDRLKKQKAKSVVPTRPDTPESDPVPDEPPVPGLDVTNYSDVSNLAANMGMGGQVKEMVAVDSKGRKLRVVMGGEKVMNEFSKRMDEENEVQGKLDHIAAKFNAARAAAYGAGAKKMSQAEVSKAKKELAEVVDEIGDVLQTDVAYRLLVQGQRKTFYSDRMKLVLHREEPGYKAPSLKREEPLRRAISRIEGKIDAVASRLDGKH